MPPWSRASELYRTLECPAASNLPRTDRPSGKAATWGTEMHAVKAGAQPDRTAAWWEKQGGLGVLKDWWPDGKHEVFLYYSQCVAGLAAVDLRSELPRNAMAGTADWVTTDGPVPWVDDLKTGRFWPGDPVDLPQLLFYGLSVSRYFGSPGALLSITHWPRYPLSTPPTRLVQLATPSHLDSFEERLDKAQRASAETPDLAIPGPWCQYCPCTGCRFNPEGSR